MLLVVAVEVVDEKYVDVVELMFEVVAVENEVEVVDVVRRRHLVTVEVAEALFFDIGDRHLRGGLDLADLGEDFYCGVDNRGFELDP